MAVIWLSLTLAWGGDREIGSAGGSEREDDRLLAGGLAPTVAAPILNGREATVEEFPMTGGLVISAEVGFVGASGGITSKLLMCTSTLIAPDVVLTAGHCVDVDALLETSGYGDQITLSNVVFGWTPEPDLSAYSALTLVDPGWPAGTSSGADAVAHEDFSLASLRIGLYENNDIALVFLDEPVLDTPFAWLPTEEEADQIQPGEPVQIVGWGQQTSDQQPPPGTVGVKHIADSVIGEVAKYEIQIGDSPDDGRKCHGDSGGPTYFAVEGGEDPDPMRVIGVTSHSYDFTDCASQGGVDTRVDFYLEWIEEQMVSRCDDGTRAWCDQPGIPKQKVASTAGILTDDEKGGCNSAGRGPTGLAMLCALLAVRKRR